MRRNPLLDNFKVPPFSQIVVEDYSPAILSAIQEARDAIDSIANSQDSPTFDNTISALEFSSLRLDRITSILFNLNHADTSSEIQELALELSPVITSFSNDVTLNDELFARVRVLYDNKESLSLDVEQSSLLDKTYRSFVRSGALLDSSQKQRYREITEELSKLSLQFSQNLLKATNSYYLHLTCEEQLSGLPQFAREIGSSEAESRDLEGWVYNLSFQSYIPFMQYADSRELREQLWTKYNSRCFEQDENYNGDIINRKVSLRMELAQLLGYVNHAGYVLEERMAKDQQTAQRFIDNLTQRTHPFAQRDWNDVVEYAQANGFEGEFMPWDFSYYAEKLKTSRYDISDDILKPYFSLENIQNGLFDTINRLYSIEFVENCSVERYHNDVKAYDIVERGEVIALLYVDYFPRESKSSGAWMTSYQDRVELSDDTTLPIISVVCNFSKPTQDAPSLLTFNEVTTMFHEFGHALHGIFARGKYPSLNGTNVSWDFVELPSQIMENWATETEFLERWATHYKTGESINPEYIEKIKASNNFLSGYAQMRQLSFATCDMAWHTLTSMPNVTLKEFEREALKPTQIAQFNLNSCVSTAFSHIFAGGYSAGYYSYKWAEVLEADAFELFKEQGVYNKSCAESFRESILSRGSQLPAMELYIEFRGREPHLDALFDKLGLGEAKNSTAPQFTPKTSGSSSDALSLHSYK